jgi:Peptidase A4 family
LSWAAVGDGSTSGTSLIQDGTEQDISTSGATSYYFWFEVVPGQDQQEVTNLAAKPGDQVGVSASYDTLVSGDASFVICDFTSGLCGDASESAHKPDNHAEWIVERTAYCNASKGYFWLPALASFAVVNLSDAYYDLTGPDGNEPEFPVSHGSPTLLYMEDVNGRTLATPGSLDSTGADFLVEWNYYGAPSEFEPPQTC